MRIAELFHSIQGEGEYTGTPSAFVRTTGCNLRCWFCDTPYTSWEPEGFHWDWRDVVDRVRGYGCEHVVVTGGEPLLQPEIVPLTRALHEGGHFITIETAGTVYRPVHADLMSISPKLENSTPDDPHWHSRHDRLRENRSVTARLCSEFRYQLKFVVDRPEDLAAIEAYLSRHGELSREHVWLMPQATTKAELERKTPWLEQGAAVKGYRVSPRLHIELFGNERGR